MKFMILMSDVQGVWDALSEQEQGRVVERHGEFERALRAEGKYVASYRVGPATEARTVRLDSSGVTSLHGGPFGGAQECVGGLYIIEAESMDEAMGWAEKSRFVEGANEVRRLCED